MKFSKFYLLPVLLVFLLFLSACAQKNDNEMPMDEESFFSGTALDLFNQKKPIQCTATFEDEEGVVEMTYYFDNKGERFRVESNILNKYDAGKINSYGILKDDWYYFWDDLTNTDGMKTKIFEEEDEDDYEEEDTKDENDFDLEEEFDFKCKSWKVDDSFFELPKDKSFKDLTDMLGDINLIDSGSSDPAGLDFNNTDFCSYCDMLPAGPERDECLEGC